ncbi:unnamed protein product [Closterium sp. NIES-64]|nr:unnamed protein product [Closterium sp. NIES-64]
MLRPMLSASIPFHQLPFAPNVTSLHSIPSAPCAPNVPPPIPRFQGSDKARNMTAVFLGVIILVVAALLAAIGVSVTINTRRLREKTTALEMLKGRAEVAERNKGVLIANTAHELRTPIYGMEGMLKQLDEGGLDLGQREDVGAAGEEAERILRLVNAVLDVCKAEAGCLHLESVPFALRPWLRDVLHPHCAGGGLLSPAASGGQNSRMAFWEQMGQRGLARAVTGACNKRVFQRSLSAQCLRCYWRMPLVQEGGSEQEESEERGESKEREEGKERESVQEQIRGAPVIPLQHGVENGGEHLSVVGGRSSERVCSELSEGRGGAASLSLEDECGRRGKGPCEHGAGVRGGDVGREEGREAEGGVGKRCMVLVACEDTGCGIAQEEQHDVFQAFMQTRAHGGNGMSLHLCRQLVSLMGGSIGLISTEGHGTTLHVALAMPVAAATAAVAVYGNSTSARTNVPGPATTCATSSSTAAADDTAVPRVVEMNSVRDCLKELLQGKAILLHQVVDGNAINCMPSLPSMLIPSLTPVRVPHVLCRWWTTTPSAGGWHVIPSFRSHPIRGSIGPTHVVDDNVINRRVAASTLAQYGAEVALAESGEAALRLL